MHAVAIKSGRKKGLGGKRNVFHAQCDLTRHSHFTLRLIQNAMCSIGLFFAYAIKVLV